MRKNRRARLYENVLKSSSVESSLVSLILTIEYGINNVNHVFNMSLDKLYSLEYDNKVSSGGSNSPVPTRIHVGSPAV